MKVPHEERCSARAVTTPTVADHYGAAAVVAASLSVEPVSSSSSSSSSHTPDQIHLHLLAHGPPGSAFSSYWREAKEREEEVEMRAEAGARQDENRRPPGRYTPPPHRAAAVGEPCSAAPRPRDATCSPPSQCIECPTKKSPRADLPSSV